MGPTSLAITDSRAPRASCMIGGRDTPMPNNATSISRRSFHKLALAGVGLPAVGPLLPSASSSRPHAPAQRSPPDRGPAAPYRDLSELEPRSLRRGLALLEPAQPVVGGDGPATAARAGDQRPHLRRSLFCEPGLGGRCNQHGRAGPGHSVRHEAPDLGQSELQLWSLAAHLVWPLRATSARPLATDSNPGRI